MLYKLCIELKGVLGSFIGSHFFCLFNLSQSKT